MSDPFARYDAWLTTDRLAEAQQDAYEAEEDAWAAWCEHVGFPDLDTSDPEYRRVKEAWLHLHRIVNEYHDHQQAEQEAELRREEERDAPHHHDH